MLRVMSNATRNGRAYLVGSGIASLAAAAYLIRDGGYPGTAIEIFDESALAGGSLDGAGSPESGYRLRGGRMLNFTYVCTYDLFSFIPSLRDPGLTVLDEIEAFNARNPTRAASRLVEKGVATDVSSMGFSVRDRLDLLAISARSEESLGTKRIDECFAASFFETNFWFMWATTFAFQPWHSAVEFKRYLHRFIQEFPRIDTLAGVDRTPFDQYDSLVLPLVAWLQARGVTIRQNTRVVEIGLNPATDRSTVESLTYTSDGASNTVVVDADDIVIVTLGSMTAGSTWGSMTSPPRLENKGAGGSWALWEQLARDRPALGRPHVFDERIEESAWVSFTMTFTNVEYFARLQAFTGTALSTFRDSNWLMSVVLAHQPHFKDQPSDVCVAWGYGLFIDKPGNYVEKTLAEASGEDIMIELLGHLNFDWDRRAVLDSVICLPCMMPFITSQFLTRAKGDRPTVIPHGSTNLALVGQYCEIPSDTVFTVEYSVRAAQIAVIGLLKLENSPTPMYDGSRHPAVLRKALAKLLT
jgi:oleate hydratase